MALRFSGEASIAGDKEGKEVRLCSSVGVVGVPPADETFKDEFDLYLSGFRRAALDLRLTVGVEALDGNG